MNLNELIRMRKWAKKRNYQIYWDSKTDRWGAALHGDKDHPITPLFDKMEQLQECLIQKMYEDMASK